MAEIRVEERKRSLGWLWALIALLVIAAVAYYFLFMSGSVTVDTTPETGALPGAAGLAAHAVALFTRAA